MAKTVLILVLSSDFAPYSTMIETSKKTWDSVEVPGCDTIFYCSMKDNPNFRQSEKVMYWDVDNTLFSMGYKNLAMFEWALKNKEFDYVLRVNASCYVHKPALMEFIETLQDENVFVGAEVTDASKENERWAWGGCSFILSKDVIQKIVDNKEHYNHSVMEDKSLSYLMNRLSIPYTPAKSGSIDNMGDHWRLVGYGTDSINFTDFSDVKRYNHHVYRVKCDGKRYMDGFIMEELFRVLNS